MTMKACRAEVLKLTITCLLLLPFFLPIYLLLPGGVRATVYHYSFGLASTFKDFSELRLSVGKTCNQSQTSCLDSFILDGEISSGDAGKFGISLQSLMSGNPNISVICLNSVGGPSEDAASIAKVIKSAGLDTCVGDLPRSMAEMSQKGLRYTAACESACTMMVLAGKRRIAVGDRFKFGIHAARMLIETKDHGGEEPGMPSVGASQTSSDATYMSSLARHDLTRLWSSIVAIPLNQLNDVLDENEKTPATRMYYLSPAEQVRLGFFTERFGGD